MSYPLKQSFARAQVDNEEKMVEEVQTECHPWGGGGIEKIPMELGKTSTKV